MIKTPPPFRPKLIKNHHRSRDWGELRDDKGDHCESCVYWHEKAILFEAETKKYRYLYDIMVKANLNIMPTYMKSLYIKLTKDIEKE